MRKGVDSMRLIIDEIIENSGLKNGYIADKINVNPRTLYKWRKGDTFPRLDKAVQLADILGVRVTDLYVK